MFDFTSVKFKKIKISLIFLLKTTEIQIVVSGTRTNTTEVFVSIKNVSMIFSSSIQHIQFFTDWIKLRKTGKSVLYSSEFGVKIKRQVKVINKHNLY